MADTTWYLVDSTGKTSPTSISSHLTLTTPPKTDIWRPSPTEDVFNAPYIYRSVRSSAFKSIKVDISADWKTQFDQGGLILLWPAETQSNSKWVKAGIELFNGKPMLGVVGCDRFSDWSLCPLPIAGAAHATIEAERVGDTLWVYFVFNGERRPLREVKWAFLEDRQTDAEIRVGIYTAKPTPERDDAEKGLEVVFRDLKLETTE